MTRGHRGPSSRLLLLIACAAGACAAAACGASTPKGGDSDAGPSSCALDPPGMFTFHVHNVGDRTISWDLGCSRTLPLALEGPAGVQPAGPGAFDYCEFTCDQIFAGTVTPGGCSDCGPGYAGVAAPGATADIVWDRRVYAAESFDASCRPSAPTPPGSTCARGHALAPSPAQRGWLTVCDGTVAQSSCRDPASGQAVATRDVELTVDTTGGDAVVDVR